MSISELAVWAPIMDSIVNVVETLYKDSVILPQNKYLLFGLMNQPLESSENIDGISVVATGSEGSNLGISTDKDSRSRV